LPVRADWIAEVSELRALAAIAETQARLTLDGLAAAGFKQMACGYRQKAERLENTVLLPKTPSQSGRGEGARTTRKTNIH
jgi:hypothetical protein